MQTTLGVLHSRTLGNALGFIPSNFNSLPFKVSNYLGVILDSKLSWKSNAERPMRKAKGSPNIHVRYEFVAIGAVTNQKNV